MTILVVDDEVDIKELYLQRFRREIRAQRLQFAFAHSAQQALDYRSDQDSGNLLILPDINMPGMLGLELLRRIRSEYSQPPPVIIIITAYRDALSHEQAMADGANEFLSKPLDFEQLKAKLHPLTTH